VVNGEMF
jgi:hypothetical protein